MFPDVPRRPLRATLPDTSGERRQNRFQPGPCSGCGHDEMRIMLRTAYVLYLRCEHCLAMKTVPKPGQDLFGT
jgi:hypothetical protein